MTDSDITIRQLGPADLPLLLATPDGLFDDRIVPERAREFLYDPRSVLMAAIDEGTIVGFASAVVTIHPDKARPELWINEVGVTDAYQRRGIGKRIMEAITAKARREGYSAVWVLTDMHNDAACALYRSAGFAETRGIMLFEISLSDEPN